MPNSSGVSTRRAFCARWLGNKGVSNDGRTNPCGKILLQRLRGRNVARCELGIQPGAAVSYYRWRREGGGGDLVGEGGVGGGATDSQGGKLTIF